MITNKETDKILNSLFTEYEKEKIFFKEDIIDPEQLFTGIPLNKQDIDVWTDLNEFEIIKSTLLSETDFVFDEEKFLSVENKNNWTKNDSENICQREIAQRVFLNIDEDKMEAKIILSKPYMGERPITERDIYKLLAEHGIVRGIRNEYIERLVENPIYDTTFLIARGNPAIKGEDGYLKLYFDNTEKNHYKVDKNGNIDFKNIYNRALAKKGDVLCEIVPPTKGSNGFNIVGDILPKFDGKPVKNPYGNNVEFNEDGTQLIASIGGEIVIRDDRISVLEELHVENVDNQTGNIKTTGSVIVKGHIKEGFSVTCTGDLIVMGSVEGAFLNIGGNVIIANGMNGGMNQKGKITAGGYVKSLFLENLTIIAKGEIIADAILNCNIDTYSDILLHGKRASLVGGVCKFAGSIIGKNIGNEAQTTTILNYVTHEEMMDKRNFSAIQLLQYKDSLHKLKNAYKILNNKNVSDSQKRLADIKYQITERTLQKQIEKTVSELVNIDNYIKSDSAKGTLKASQNMYANLVIMINGKKYTNNKTRQNAIMKLSKNGIKVANTGMGFLDNNIVNENFKIEQI